jgi:hypothetical protein
MGSKPTAVLLGCVKSKVDHPAAAGSLYRSPLWQKRRAYAEASGLRWMILSAKYGLVEPERRLRPYHLALSELSAPKRRDWGEQVVASLQEHFGSLQGSVFEVHAGAVYRNAIQASLTAMGGSITVPLQGLSLGGQLHWYASDGAIPRRRTATSAEVRRALRNLDGAPAQITASDWPGTARGLDQPGLYSWWVDTAGAKDLAAGLGHRVRGGRIYTGQTGATKWPSGTIGKATLGSRIGDNHLRGSIGSSTFRQTLAAALATPLQLIATAPKKLDRESEQRLSEWMRAHLHVAVHPFSERDALVDLEEQVLTALDPPLNLEGMQRTPLRDAMTRARRSLSRHGRRGDAGSPRPRPQPLPKERT